MERDREKRAYEALKKQESQNKSEDFQTRYSEKQKEVQVLRRKIAALHDERKTYGQEEDARVRVQLLREQLSEKAHTMNAKESQLRSSAELVLGSSGVLNGNNLQESISATVLELMNSLSTAESDLAQKRSLLSGKEAEMKIFDDRISAMQSMKKSPQITPRLFHAHHWRPMKHEGCFSSADRLWTTQFLTLSISVEPD